MKEQIKKIDLDYRFRENHKSNFLIMKQMLTWPLFKLIIRGPCVHIDFIKYLHTYMLL